MSYLKSFSFAAVSSPICSAFVRSVCPRDLKGTILPTTGGLELETLGDVRETMARFQGVLRLNVCSIGRVMEEDETASLQTNVAAGAWGIVLKKG